MGLMKPEDAARYLEKGMEEIHSQVWRKLTMSELICVTSIRVTMKCQMCGIETHVLYTVRRTDDLAMDLCHSCYKKENPK
jgi:hypothetical protein